MNFLERIRIGWAAFRAADVGSIDLPENGRSSKETLNDSIGAFLTTFGSVNPVIDFDMLATLKNLWLFNPDVSQYAANIVNLGNPGHSLKVTAVTDAIAENAVNRLNESAVRIYSQGCGVDGLLNQYLASIAWSGAVSSEDVVNLAARRVEKVVLVPVESIRFKYDKDKDEYLPYQRNFGTFQTPSEGNSFGLIALNPETYSYLPVATVENSPYARPPASAAVGAILESQIPLMENIRYMAQKIGLMGLVAASVVPPKPRPNEDDSVYQTRAKNYLAAVRSALEGNFNKGLLVTFRDQKIEHTPITSGAQGVYDINRISEEQVFSGLGAMPGFHGRTDSTTETFADVVYYLLTAQVANMQRVVKRRQERTYRLDLRLAGIEVDSVSLTFDKAHSRNAKAEAETDAIKFNDMLGRVRAGLLDPQAAAQQLGESEWFDESRLFNDAVLPKEGQSSNVVRLEFDRSRNEYKFSPEVITLASESLKLSEDEIDQILERFIREYRQLVSPFADDATAAAVNRLRDFLRDNDFENFSSAEEFADELVEQINKAFGSSWSRPATVRAIEAAVREVYTFYRLRDSSVFGDASPIRLRFGGPDKAAMNFIGKLDHFYFSKFADNSTSSLRQFLIDAYLKDGAALFGRESSEEIDAFRRAAGVKLKNLTDRQVLTIVQTAVQRIRNWAHIGTLDQAGFEYAKLVATIDNRTSILCLSIDGKRIRVGVAKKAVDRLGRLAPKEFAQELYESDEAKQMRQDPSANVRANLEPDGKTIKDDLVASGLGFPPFHPNCRTRMEGIIEDINE